MSNNWMEEFPKIWAKMLARRDSEFFRDPVDWEALELYDYPEIIEKPMDLNTVKRNFDNGVYRTASDLATDMRLIFMNAMTYNDPASKVFNHAKAQREFWENSWANVVKNEIDVDRPPTVEVLTEFVEKCHRMTPEDLAQVLRLLAAECPNCMVKKPDTNEIDVNTDLITGKAFHEVNKLLDSLIEGPATSSNSRRSTGGSTGRVKTSRMKGNSRNGAQGVAGRRDIHDADGFQHHLSNSDDTNKDQPQNTNHLCGNDKEDTTNDNDDNDDCTGTQDHRTDDSSKYSDHMDTDMDSTTYSEVMALEDFDEEIPYLEDIIEEILFDECIEFMWLIRSGQMPLDSLYNLEPLTTFFRPRSASISSRRHSFGNGNDFPSSSSKGTGSVSSSQSSTAVLASKTVVCQLCKEIVAGVRYAPHLERCMNGGKRGARKHYDFLHDNTSQSLPYYSKPKPKKEFVDPHPDSLVVRIRFKNGVPVAPLQRHGATLEDFEAAKSEAAQYQAGEITFTQPPPTKKRGPGRPPSNKKAALGS